MTGRNQTLLAAVALVLVAGLVAGPVAAQTNSTNQTVAPYYDDTTPSVNNGTWLSGLTDASLEDVLDLAVRVGPFIIGSGVTAQGGVGSAGALLTGALVGAVLVGTGMRARAGPVGGAVIAVGATSAFVTVGIGPSWLYPLVLFAVGLLATVALIRALR